MKKLSLIIAAIVLFSCKSKLSHRENINLDSKPVIVIGSVKIKDSIKSDLLYRKMDSTLYRIKCDYNYMEAYHAEQRANIDWITTDNPRYKKLFYKHQKDRVYWAKEGIRVDNWIKSANQ